MPVQFIKNELLVEGSNFTVNIVLYNVGDRRVSAINLFLRPMRALIVAKLHSPF